MTLRLLALCLLLPCALAARAYMTLAGPTGTGVLPNAFLEAPRDFDLAYSFLHSGASVETERRYLIGLSPQFELGLNVTTGLNETQNADFWNAKFQFAVSHDAASTYALGWRHGGADGTVYGRSTQLYLARTQTHEIFLLEGINTTVGLSWTEVDINGSEEHAVRPFLSAEIVFTPNTSLALDFQLRASELETGPLYSIVFRQGALEFGLTTITPTGVTGREKAFLFAGVNIPTSRYEPPAPEEPEEPEESEENGETDGTAMQE